jgi:hypothetical protein
MKSRDHHQKLFFRNLRKPFETDSTGWTPSERAQIEAMAARCRWSDLLADWERSPSEFRFKMEEWEMLYTELADVVDETGEAVFQVYFFDFGTGFLFHSGTDEVAGSACQHYFRCGDAVLAEGLAEAYAQCVPPVEQRMTFGA